MHRIILACALVGVLAGPAFGQGVDPLIGTWKLNLEKSTYVGVPADKSETLTFTGEGQHFIDTIDRVDAQGRVFKQVTIHIYDEMPHPTTGNPNYDASAYTRVGNAINVVRFRQGKTVEVGQIVIVPGKTYTATAEGNAANGEPYRYDLVFDRQ